MSRCLAADRFDLRKLAERLRVVAIIDVDTNRARDVLALKMESAHRAAYADCLIYDNVDAAQRSLPVDASPQ